MDKHRKQDELQSYLSELVEDQQNIEDCITDTVEKLREEGQSWAVVGKLLGITRQAAQQKYGKTASTPTDELPLSDPLFDPLFKTPQISD